jgi:hypothetical protein
LSCTSAHRRQTYSWTQRGLLLLRAYLASTCVSAYQHICISHLLEYRSVRAPTTTAPAPAPSTHRCTPDSPRHKARTIRPGGLPLPAKIILSSDPYHQPTSLLAYHHWSPACQPAPGLHSRTLLLAPSFPLFPKSSKFPPVPPPHPSLYLLSFLTHYSVLVVILPVLLQSYPLFTRPAPILPDQSLIHRWLFRFSLPVTAIIQEHPPCCPPSAASVPIQCRTYGTLQLYRSETPLIHPTSIPQTTASPALHRLFFRLNSLLPTTPTLIQRFATRYLRQSRTTASPLP